VRVEADELPIVRPGLPMMRMNTGVEVELDATGELTTVDVGLTDPFLDVLETAVVDNPDRLPASDGIVFVDAQGRRRAARRNGSEGPAWIPRGLDITVRLEDPLRVRGPQADMDWGGRIEVRRPAGGALDATGSFRAQGGRVSLLGNDFDLDYAEIRLPEDPSGPPDPYIDLIAATETAEASVTMTVRGRVSRPELRLDSDPPMPQSDILALLITGRSNASAAEQDSFGAKAASVLAAFENPALQRYLRDRVGIDRVGVGFGQTVEEPIVTVGKRINRKLYVEAEYHHNAPDTENQAEARLEYTFVPHWSVETEFGDAAAGGVSLWWTHRFGPLGDDPGPAESKNSATAVHRTERRASVHRRTVAGSRGASPPTTTHEVGQSPHRIRRPIEASIRAELERLDARYDALDEDARAARDDDVRQLRQARRRLDRRVRARIDNEWKRTPAAPESRSPRVSTAEAQPPQSRR
jgi:hypothetical protein